jgi:hypothetical protein
MRKNTIGTRTLLAGLLLAIPLAAITAMTASPAFAAPRGDDSNRKSKNGRAQGTAGGAQVTLEYGRPYVSGRKIWGSLVPYGQVWRAGADEATTITFDKPVKIEGQPLAAGQYALFLIPSESGAWTVIFNKVADQWGAYKYDAAQDALRVDVKPKDSPMVETLEYAVGQNRVEMRWEKLNVGFAVSPP